jgi:hypothetical protein
LPESPLWERSTCSPESSGVASDRLLQPRRASTRRSRRRAASSFGVGFRWRVEPFAQPIPASRCHSFSPWQLWSSIVRSSSRGALFGARRGWLHDPLRPSAGGASPDPVTSDALCRPAALTQEGSTPSRSLTARFRPSCERPSTRALTAAARMSSAAAYLRRAGHTPSRTSSISLMPDLAIEPELRGLLVLHVRVRALQHPSRASASMPFLCRGRSRRTALPCPTLMRLTAHLGIAGKMPLTDFCNRHFRLEHPIPIARLPSPQLAPR